MKQRIKTGLLIIFLSVSFAGWGQRWVYAQENKPHFFQIKNEQNALTLHSEYENESQQVVSSSGRVERSRILFQEELETEFSGSVYHPNLMDFDFSLGIAQEQDKEKSDTESLGKEFRNSHLSRHRFITNFLKGKPVNASLFTETQREVSNRDFFERQIIDSSGYGGRFSFFNKEMPIDFDYSKTQQDIDRSFRSDQTYIDDVFNLHLEPKFIKFGQTDFDYSRDEYQRMEEGINDQNGVSDNMSLINRYEWGEENRKSLNTYLRYFSFENSHNNNNLGLDESLTWEHTDDLQSFYRYGFSDSAVEDIDSMEQDLTAGFNHQLYESLKSVFSVSGRAADTTSFEEKEISATINEDYTKNIGFSKLGLGLDYIFERRNRDSLDNILRITNESHALDDSAVVFLNQLNVDTSRIIVTNDTGTVSYIENIDYRIIQHGSGFTEIKRIVTSISILNGANVLVDYLVAGNPSFGFSTMQNNYRFSLGFWDNKLQFYSRYRQQRHGDFDGASNLLLEKIDNRIVGCQMNLNGVGLSAEYEDYDSDLNPFTVFRLREDFTWDISSKSIFTLHSSQDYVNLMDDNRENYDVRGIYSTQLTRTATGIWENGYRRQKGRDTDIENLASRLSYRLNVGLMSFESGYEFEKEYSLDTDFDSHYVFTTLKRKF